MTGDRDIPHLIVVLSCAIAIVAILAGARAPAQRQIDGGLYDQKDHGRHAPVEREIVDFAQHGQPSVFARFVRNK